MEGMHRICKNDRFAAHADATDDPIAIFQGMVYRKREKIDFNG